jgi:hypothetical protein
MVADIAGVICRSGSICVDVSGEDRCNGVALPDHRPGPVYGVFLPRNGLKKPPAVPGKDGGKAAWHLFLLQKDYEFNVNKSQPSSSVEKHQHRTAGKIKGAGLRAKVRAEVTTYARGSLPAPKFFSGAFQGARNNEKIVMILPSAVCAASPKDSVRQNPTRI